MKKISNIMLLILAILGITFTILNSQSVTLNYYFGHSTFSLSILLVLSLSVGAIIGFLLAVPKLFRLRRRVSKLKSTLKKVERDTPQILIKDKT